MCVCNVAGELLFGWGVEGGGREVSACHFLCVHAHTATTNVSSFTLHRQSLSLSLTHNQTLAS